MATTKSETKSKTKDQDSQKLGLSAEPTQPPTDEYLHHLQQEQDDLHKPGRASKTDAEQIDNSPGYNKDQLNHMREYYGLKESTADVADTNA